MLRLILLILGLFAVVLIPFLIWGEAVEAQFSTEAAADWVRGFGAWGWAMGVALITSDILLPVPATGVMAALGLIYGPWLGGAIAASGSFLAGLLGYGLCRALGPRAAAWLAGPGGFDQAHGLFQRYGGWLVAGSRWLPILPETVSFLAGLVAMPFARFTAALACGAIPFGFAFAAVGHYGADRPILTLVLAGAAPIVLWFFVKPILLRREHGATDPAE